MAKHYVLRALPSSQQAAWDAFVNEHPQGHLLQSWGWGELKTSANWQPVRLGLWDERVGEMVAAAQVLQRTVSPIPARVAHLAYIPKGPLLDWSAHTEDGSSLARLFLSEMRAYLRRRGALALHIEPNLELETAEGQAALHCLKELRLRETRHVQPARTITLDLRPDEATLLAQMKEKWRYNVRLAGRKGVEVHSAESAADVDAWYALLETTGERDQFGIHTLEYYRKAWQVLGTRQQARLFLAYAEGELLAGIFVSLMAREAIYLYGASSNARRNLMPNYLLQWEAMRWAKQNGACSYDFWGIPATDEAEEAMAGVYRFKSGWGGRVVRFLGTYEDVYRPLLMSAARRVMG